MRGGPRSFPQGSTCPVVLWILPRWPRLRLRGSHPLWPAFPGPFGWLLQSLAQSEPRRARTPVWAPPVPLAATPGITVVFSSSGYLDVSVRRVPSSMPMCSAWGGGVFPRRVSPFRHPRIHGYVPLPAAFRSLSRLSSAPGAKASALCPSLLNRSLPPHAPSVALPRVVPGFPPGCSGYRFHAPHPWAHFPPPPGGISLLDVRWGLPHRLVLFVSIRFSRYSWRLLPPMGSGWARTTPPPAGPMPALRDAPCGLLSPVSSVCLSPFFQRCSGGHLLSHALWRSTIGRPRLDHRVRDGYGYPPRAHRHRNLLAPASTGEQQCGPYSPSSLERR